MVKIKSANKTIHPLFLYLMISLILTACIPGMNGQQNIATPSPTPVLQNLLFADISFDVVIPQKSQVGSKIYVDVLDDVTGLGLNTLRYNLKAIDDTHYSIHIPLVSGSIVKYHYVKDSGSISIETTPNGEPVNYRLFSVTGSSEVTDVVSGWTDIPYGGAVGRIQGSVKNATTDAPLPDVLVSAGGLTTLTSSDGSYILEGLPPGVHNLLAYSIDGGFRPYQQYATVAENSTTPAPLKLESVPLVNVTFIVQPPVDSMAGVPIRMVGNLYSLGNTLVDNEGGMNVIAARAPFLSLTSDGKYTLTLSLPEGQFLRYKYTLGDGFWNAEHNKDTSFRLREMVIPNKDTAIYDSIDTWTSGSTAPVTIMVDVPEITPPNDVVSIQFNPYNWTEPIPMWPLGNNQWVYILYSPLDVVGDTAYRFCRNDQCIAAVDLRANGADVEQYTLHNNTSPQTINNKVDNWALWKSPGTAVNIIDYQIKPRGANFMAGVEFEPGYNPSWQPYLASAFQDVADTGANWLILTPMWSCIHNNLPVFEPVPGADALWFDNIQMSEWARQRVNNLAIFPTINYGMPADAWWSAETKDAGWWQSWFDRYRVFILNYADLATQIDAKVLILGGPNIQPALPGGKLSTGASSGVPEYSKSYWKQLISEIKTHFNGSLVWALSYPSDLNNIPDFISDFDQVYILWSASLEKAVDSTPANLTTEFGRLLDSDVKPLRDKIQKPIIVGINYASIKDAQKGCFTQNNSCLSFDLLNQPVITNSDVTIDLGIQENIYIAALTAINQRDWINGFVTRGFYPPVGLQDNSSSVHGKPANEFIKYWFPRLLAEANK